MHTPVFTVAAGELLQHVSRVAYRGEPLHYGRDGANRYDDPGRVYGVLYLGCDLPTALMESVFHKHQWLADHRHWPGFVADYRVGIETDPGAPA